MSKILINNTPTPVPINDVGQTVPASSQITIDPVDYALYAASNNVITLISDLAVNPTTSTLTVNDGSGNLSIADGSKLIQGIFPNPVGVAAGTDLGPIGRVGDSLKTTATVIAEENLPITLPEYEDYLYRIRTTRPVQLFQGQWGFNGQPLVWSNQSTGGATLEEPDVTGHNFIKFKTTSASGDKFVYQTKRYFRYQPSRTHSLTFACAFGDPTVNLIKRAGQFDDSVAEGQNGFFIENDGANGITFGVASTSSGSQTFDLIPRSQWNVDQLDGTGPSGLNFTDTQLGNVCIWNIDYSWYGASGVQFNIIVGPRRIVLHEQTYSLTNPNFPFTKTAFLPLRLEIENTGTVSGGGEFTVGSISYDIENGEENEFGFQFSSGNKAVFKSVSAGGTIIYALRCQATINGIENRGVLVPNNLEVLSTADIYYEVLIGGQVSGGSWNSVSPNSIAEENTTATGYTGGRVIKSGYIATTGGRGGGSLFSSFPGDLFVAIDSLLGTQDAVAVRVTRIGSSTQAGAELGWREIY